MIDTKLAFVESKVTVIIRMNIVRTDIPRKAGVIEFGSIAQSYAQIYKTVWILTYWLRMKCYNNIIYRIVSYYQYQIWLVSILYSDIHDWHTSQMGGSIPILINHILLVRPCQSFNRCQKVFKLAVNCFQEAFYILI